MTELWRVLQTRAVYQAMFYLFFASMFTTITTIAAAPVQSILVHVSPFSSNISTILGSFVYMLGIVATGKYGLHWNWRWMIIATGLTATVLDASTSFLAVWDVVRNQWFNLGLPGAANLPQGVKFLVSSFVLVEIAGEGHAGTMYGLLSTVSNLPTPFASTLTRIIDSRWNLSNERIKEDTSAV